jgi:inner membrane transporter RhtA
VSSRPHPAVAADEVAPPGLAPPGLAPPGTAPVASAPVGAGPVGAGWRTRAGQAVTQWPPVSYFLVSVLFHYLGPSFAVLLFAHLSVLPVAWLRIASAAVVFALWRRPWRLARTLTPAQRWVLLALGAVLAAMNSLFYLAIDRLPLSTVGAIEFLGTVVLAAIGVRATRNFAALALAVGGVALLTALRLGGDPLGFVFAFANCAGFMLYVMLGHRIANIAADGSQPARGSMSGIDQLGAAMLVAAIVAAPAGLPGTGAALAHPLWLLWGIGVGVCSSVIPYVTDQLAMARLPRATFALMLALLPMFATLIGVIVLRQIPTFRDVLGLGLVIAGVALHRGPAEKMTGAEHAVRPPRPVRAQDIADRAGHDELRRSGRAGLGAAIRPGRAHRPPGR